MVYGIFSPGQRICDLLKYEDLHQKLSDLCSSSDFHKSSTDLMQMICGHRAEILQMRRDSILKHVKDSATRSSLRKVPPSVTHLFSAEKFSAVLERAGGIRKCFWPAQKINVTAASQAASRKSHGPAQGPRRNIKPAQGFSWGNRSYPQPSCSHVAPPPQGGFRAASHRAQFNSAALNNDNFQGHDKGNSFRQFMRQQDQGKTGRRRALSPTFPTRNNKKRKF